MILLEKLTGACKKLAIGFGVAAGVTGGVLAVFDKFSVVLKATFIVGGYVLCGVGALVWARIAETGLIRRRARLEEVMTSEAVIRPEDHLAYVANKCARRYFGRETVTFEEYRHWRRHNRYIFTAVVSQERELLGFFDVLPLRDELGKQMREGTMAEKDITIDDILSETEIEHANYVYIATVMSCVINDHFDARLIQHLAEFVLHYYPPRESRVYFAFAASTEGRNLLKRNGFILELNNEITSCNRDLFALESPRVPEALLRFSNRRQSVRSRRTRRLLAASASAESTGAL